MSTDATIEPRSQTQTRFRCCCGWAAWVWFGEVVTIRYWSAGYTVRCVSHTIDRRETDPT